MCTARSCRDGLQQPRLHGGQVHRTLGFGHQLIQLTAPSHQGRGHDHAPAGGADNQPFLEADGAAALGDIVLVGETLAAGLVFGELQGGDQAGGLDITHQRVIAEHLTQALLQVGAGVVLKTLKGASPAQD